jgi:hypothetical protein
LFINKTVHMHLMIAAGTMELRDFNVLAMLISSVSLVSLLASVPGSAEACTNWAGLADDDCDQLANTWETQVSLGGGYDVNGDRVIDLDLYALGARPNHKDILLEIDYMKYHKPRTNVVENVKAAFANAPVSNPGTTNGVNLIYRVNEQVTHEDSVTMWNWFDWRKGISFGFDSTERANPNKMQAKANTYHYALFIHQYNGGSSSGSAELPGTDLFVSLGAPGWGQNSEGNHTVGSHDQQEGTLIHELGHNLGLRHGGDVDENCKPNYLSAMSYSFQFSDYVSGRPLDYSQSVLKQLNEASLSEPDGVSQSTPAGLKTVYGPTSGLVSPPLSFLTNPIDWDRDGNPTETGINKNINNLGSNSGCTSTSTTPLLGYNDWSHLQYWGIGGSYANGTAFNATGLANLTDSANVIDAANFTAAAILPLEANLTGTGNYTAGANLTGAGNFTAAANVTDSGISWDAREGLDEKNVDNLKTSRQSLLQSIHSYVTSFPVGDFNTPGSKNILIGELRKIQTQLSIEKIPDRAIRALNENISKKMDGSFGGNPSDDLLTDPEAQRLVVPQVDNLIQALLKQRGIGEED